MSAKKKILILPRWYPHRGDVQLGNFIRQQAHLIAQDFDISVIYVQAESTLKTTYELNIQKINNVREVIVYFKSGNGVLAKFINARRYKKAQQFALEKITLTPDLCHVHVPYRSAFLALQLLRKNKIPFVITEHWSGHLTGEFNNKNAVDKKLYRNILGKARGITCVSKLLAKKFEENTGYQAEIIPNSIEFSNASHPKIDNEKIQILSVSDMNDAVKGISEMIHAFSKALQLKTNLNLKIIGGGPDEKKIQNLISNLNLDDKVFLLGRQPHNVVLKEISNCDFYICNSKFETFGMAVAEALIAGKPVVCSRCGGPEEFLHKENSIISEPSNLTEKIIEMAEQFQNFDKQKISEEVQSKYGRETVRKNWINFYSKILDIEG